MKVFISWSGTRSKELAIALKEWLPLVLQYVEPWVSEKDISAGERWAQAIAGELESSNFGIICVTPENLNSEWILFEAGALSKSMLDAKVVPLLFGLELSDLGGPLSQFQAQKADETGLMEIIKSINKVSDNKASDSIVSQLVPTLWPTLLQKISEIPDKVPAGQHKRPQHEILEELVTSVRGLSSRMRNIDPEMMERDPRFFAGKHRDFHPGMIDEMIHMVSDGRDDRGVSLLMLAGLVREQFPWLAEIMVESYRELKHADVEEAERIAHRLRRVTKIMLRGPFGERFLGRSKSSHMFAMELPHLIDRALRHPVDPARTDVDGETSHPDEL